MFYIEWNMTYSDFVLTLRTVALHSLDQSICWKGNCY